MLDNLTDDDIYNIDIQFKKYINDYFLNDIMESYFVISNQINPTITRKNYLNYIILNKDDMITNYIYMSKYYIEYQWSIKSNYKLIIYTNNKNNIDTDNIQHINLSPTLSIYNKPIFNIIKQKHTYNLHFNEIVMTIYCLSLYIMSMDSELSNFNKQFKPTKPTITKWLIYNVNLINTLKIYINNHILTIQFYIKPEIISSFDMPTHDNNIFMINSGAFIDIPLQINSYYIFDFDYLLTSMLLINNYNNYIESDIDFRFKIINLLFQLIN